jgi:hypothetical protein
VKVLLWHVHGSYATALVQAGHDYVVPVLPDRSPDGLGRAATWDWPASVREVAPAALRDERPDVVLLQRPHEEALLARWTGLRAGRDVAAVYLEHNTPRGDVPLTRHPYADRDDVLLVHVTHFNALFWDSGTTRTTVVEHGVPEPAPRWTGELPRAAVVLNEPARRGRVTGTDLLPLLVERVPVDLFGMRASAVRVPGVTTHDDLAGQQQMHAELARRAVYVHPLRWTSLGLSLLEAMTMGVPVVALATTAAVEAVPPGAGVLTTRPDELAAAAAELVADRARAAAMGAAGRVAALRRYGLGRFLDDWDRVLKEAT